MPVDDGPMSTRGELSVVRRAAIVALAVLLAAASISLTIAFRARWNGTHLPYSVQWWTLIPAYLVAYQLGVAYEYRRETMHALVTHLPLVMGIVFVAPGGHVSARFLAAVLASLHAREHSARFVFNVAIGTFETAVAASVLTWMQSSPQPGYSLWISILGALLVSELSSFAVMQILLALLGETQSRASRRNWLVAHLASGALFGGCAIVFVAAVWTDPVMLAIVAVVALTLMGAYQRHQALARQHHQSSELQQFVSGLGALEMRTPEGLRVLDHVRGLLHARSLELALQTTEGWARVHTAEGQAPREDTPTPEDVLTNSSAVAAASLDGEDRMVTPLIGSTGLLGVLSVKDRLGDRSRFGAHDLRLLETLGAELAGALERGQLQHDLALAATTDPLTGLANLNEVTAQISQLLALEPDGVFVATIAVDSFREVNDTLGHQVGDELLCEVTRRLQLTFPDSILGRIGGGRFAICLARRVFGGDVAMFGLGIRAQVEGGAQLGPIGTHVKLSVGCAQSPEHGSDAPTLIRRAETAMYGARNANGGPVVWEPVYEVEGQRRLAVVMALREAVASGAIGVAYQPKIRTTDSSVAGVEALARWTHPALGAISPAEFIPLAEASGLMGPLTTLVLRQALTTCKSWQRRGGRIGVSVNVSAETLLDHTFATEVAALLTASNIAADLLTLELTEGVVVNDPALAAQRMHDLQRLGVKLSVDDFGTGYSSLTYLKGLPVDEVKIDKGFVDHVTEDMADRAVVRAVVDIAHTMGLTVVAEGVENNDQLRTLVELGVDEAQGYLLARPMAALDMAQWLRRREVVEPAPEQTTSPTTLPLGMPTQRG